jgi:AcrR family transcriptional regulator
MAGVKGRPAEPSRKERARVTRQRMVQAAFRGFTEQGYAGTTMSSVAAEAGVAVQTLYFTFRTKGELLQAAYEYAVLGPEAVAPQRSSWWQATQAEPDIVRAVHHLVTGTMTVLERAAPLVWAVLGDDDAREGYEFNEGLRRAGHEELVAILVRKHPLRPDVSLQRARDVLLVALGPQVFTQFTRDLGWSSSDVASWASRVILEQLFGVQGNPDVPS